MGRPKKFKNEKDLDRWISRYFKSISRTVTVRERYPTGEKDGWGHDVYEWRNVYNDDGELIRHKEYVVPPSISSLCLFLGISRKTWTEYCNDEEFRNSTTRARARCEAYLEEELITRAKNVQGIIFNLQNNYGWKDKKEVELGDKTRKDMAISSMSLSDKLKLISEAYDLAAEISDDPEKADDQHERE